MMGSVSFLRTHWRVLVLATLALAAFFAARFFFARSNIFEVTFLNVGQGDASFIEFPDGRQILIDGGPDASVLSELSQVMRPWDRTIDILVSTHPDADHVAGLIPVLERYRVSMIVETGIEKSTTLSHDFERAAQNEGAQIVFVDQEKRLRFSNEGELDLLWPRESHKGEVVERPNDYGIVSLLRFGAISMLFPADIERGTEAQLVRQGISHVDVLKVPHHGSKTSSSEALLNATTPNIAVISVGKKNRYGHPVPEIVDRLLRHGAKVYRTDRDGRVRLESDGATIWTR